MLRLFSWNWYHFTTRALFSSQSNLGHAHLRGKGSALVQNTCISLRLVSICQLLKISISCDDGDDDGDADDYCFSFPLFGSFCQLVFSFTFSVQVFFSLNNLATNNDYFSFLYTFYIINSQIATLKILFPKC